MPDLDMEKMGAFRQQLGGYMNAGAAVLMLSIGHQTGLFDAMATLPPATSGEIAKAADLNERYVREWLGSMVAAGIVDYKATTDAYSLPPEHAAMTTRAAGPANMARMMQFIPLLATVEEQIIDKFHNGGGVPYTEYGSFHRIMSEVSGASFDAGLVSHMLPLVPGMVAALEAGVSVADVGTGSGHAVNVMAKAFPNSTFVGFDFSEDAIAVGRAEAEAWGLFVLDAGYTVIPPNTPYPPGQHPDDHMSVTIGRTLETFTLVYITRGGGTFESRSGGQHPIHEGNLLSSFPANGTATCPTRQRAGTNTGWSSTASRRGASWVTTSFH